MMHNIVNVLILWAAAEMQGDEVTVVSGTGIELEWYELYRDIATPGLRVGTVGLAHHRVYKRAKINGFLSDETLYNRVQNCSSDYRS